MTQDNLSAQFKQITAKALGLLRKLRPYAFVLFLVFVACMYGFLLLRTSSLDSQEPNADAVTSQVKSAHLPHIDQSVVDQLKSLRDNSVNVKALFEKGRSNPFQ